MKFVLENDYLKVTVNSLGAEVKSVVRKSDGKELWWTGDERYWNGSSPILFPACGGLWNGEYTLEGNTYKMPKHGFVKGMEWERVAEDAPGMLLFSVSDTEATREAYPFRFRLTIVYRLDGMKLDCSYCLLNLEENRVMPFQIGGHPAIALPDFEEGAEKIGYIRPLFNDNTVDAHCLTVVRAGEQGCWSKERHGVNCDEEGLIPVSVATFANEALIFDHKQINGADILDLQKNRLARVHSFAPVWLFWQMQDLLCPYVCAEPWYGLCDLQQHSVQLIERPYSQTVAPKCAAKLLLWGIEF